MIYKCKNCGGNAVFNPEKQALFCPHCDSIDSADEISSADEMQCVNCGAPLKVEQFTSACRCEHCGSYTILEKRVSGEYTPHLVIPFAISKRQTIEILQKEFQRRFFTPVSFLNSATLDSMEGIYVPFWMYSYHANYDYHGTGTKIRIWHTGDIEHKETSYYRIDRNMDIDFSRIPVDASNVMPDKLMDLLEPFQYQALENFRTKYMSGFVSEYYNQSADALEDRAKEKSKKDAEELLRESISGYSSVHAENKELHMDPKAQEYALLPVWVYHYSYRGKKYDYYVNGQTGKVLGETPVARDKVLAYGASIWTFLSAILIVGKFLLEVL